MADDAETSGLHRSYLYVVGHREDHIVKAYGSRADAIVLELEDAVAASKKDAARRTVADFLAEPPPKPTYVRINPPDSGLAEADLEAVADKPIEGIRVAKVTVAADVRALADRLQEYGSAGGIQLLLESAVAVERAASLLAAHPRVLTGALGEQDLGADIGTPADEAMWYPRSRLVFAARAAGKLPPFQSVWTNLRDEGGLRASSEAGKRLGFFGRSAIHPAQVDVINDVFTPSEGEIRDAEKLRDALEAGVEAGAGGVQLPDGRFVDSAVVKRAQRTLAFAPKN